MPIKMYSNAIFRSLWPKNVYFYFVKISLLDYSRLQMFLKMFLTFVAI